MNGYINKIMNKVTEELDDAMEYANLSHEAKEMGVHCDAQMLHDMAKEEYTHAKHIEQMLKKSGMTYPDIHDKIKKLNEIL
jgi:ferritin